jgi:hypothetical protein
VCWGRARPCRGQGGRHRGGVGQGVAAEAERGRAGPRRGAHKGPGRGRRRGAAQGHAGARGGRVGATAGGRVGGLAGPDWGTAGSCEGRRRGRL